MNFFRRRILLFLSCLVFPIPGRAGNDYEGYVQGSSPVAGGYTIGVHRMGYVRAQCGSRSCVYTDISTTYDIFVYGDVVMNGGYAYEGNSTYLAGGTDMNDESGVPGEFVSCDGNQAQIVVAQYIRADTGQVMNEVFNGSGWVASKHGYVCVNTDTD